MNNKPFRHVTSAEAKEALDRDVEHVLRLCGEEVTEQEFEQYMRTGVVPKRILQSNHVRPKPWE